MNQEAVKGENFEPIPLAQGVYWRSEADCVLISTTTGVLRLDDMWRLAWNELANTVGAGTAMSCALSKNARALLGELVADGLVLPFSDNAAACEPVCEQEGWPWYVRTLGHLADTSPAP